MAFTAGLNVAQVNVRGDVDSQEIENTLYFKYTTTITLTELQQLASDVYGYWVATMLPILSTAYRLRELYVVDLTTRTSETYTEDATPLDVGGLSGSVLPNNVSLAVTFVTSKRGRSYRGRNFWPCLTESVVTDNEVSEGHAALIRGAYALMAGADEVSSGWTWGVFSRVQNKVQLTNGEFTPIQTAKITDTIVDSQRRRLPKRGR